VVPDRLRPLLAEVQPLAERFAADGKHLYLVGGIVRDQLLGKPLADLSFGYGNLDDHAIVGDWDGDGKDSPGVIRFP